MLSYNLKVAFNHHGTFDSVHYQRSLKFSVLIQIKVMNQSTNHFRAIYIIYVFRIIANSTSSYKVRPVSSINPKFRKFPNCYLNRRDGLVQHRQYHNTSWTIILFLCNPKICCLLEIFIRAGVGILLYHIGNKASG